MSCGREMITNGLIMVVIGVGRAGLSSVSLASSTRYRRAPEEIRYLSALARRGPIGCIQSCGRRLKLRFGGGFFPLPPQLVAGAQIGRRRASARL